MATAPTPGATKRARAVDAAKAKLVLTVQDEPFELHHNNLPMMERSIFRKATGEPFETYLQSVGVDSLCAIWWMARREAGEKTLTWPKAMADWDERYGALTPDDFELFEDDGMPDVTGSEAEELPDDPEG